MADDVDRANLIEAEHLARGLAAIAAVIPVGMPGECDDCGEPMPRLVGGRCGFCRDGRKPPLSFYDATRAPPAIVVASVEAAKETDMTETRTEEKKVISVPVKGATLAAILAYAERADLPLGQAVVAMIEDGRADWGPDAILLANVSDVTLAEEVKRRLTLGPGSDDLEAAIARADAAEEKLAALKGLLA